MKKPDIKNFFASINGAGFYIALLVCVAAVIIAMAYYFTISRGDDNSGYEDTSSPAVLTETEEEKPTVSMPEDTAPIDEDYVASVVEISSGTTTDSADLIVSPLTGETITSYCVDNLLYSPTMNDWRTHCGIDIAAEEGAKVRACHAGKVSEIVDNYDLGTTVTVDHGDGTSSIYANLQTSPSVRVGGNVAAGDIIGAVGSTARTETAIAPHLHFAVMQSGDYIDPEAYLAG